jgi:hypothetical protein
MTILGNIQGVINTILQERAASQDQSSTTADNIQNKAIAVINGGVSEWVDYMKLFAGTPTDPQQLARLVPTDGTGTDAGKQRARAYLVANGLCGDTTTDHLDREVTGILDQ